MQPYEVGIMVPFAVEDAGVEMLGTLPMMHNQSVDFAPKSVFSFHAVNHGALPGCDERD